MLQDGGSVEISTKPVTIDKLVVYKRYVYRDEYGLHLCIKDVGDVENNVAPFIGVNTEHFYWCDIRNIFELRDTINPSDYTYKRVDVQDLRYKTGVSPKKMEKVNLLVKKGWRILARTEEIILERKKRKRNANS